MSDKHPRGESGGESAQFWEEGEEAINRLINVVKWERKYALILTLVLVPMPIAIRWPANSS